MNIYAIIITLTGNFEMKFEVEAQNILNATKDAIATKELTQEARFLEIIKIEINKIV